MLSPRGNSRLWYWVLGIISTIAVVSLLGLLAGLGIDLSTGAQQPEPKAQAKPPEPQAVWVQMRPDDKGMENRLIVRAIVSSHADCPEIIVNNHPQIMTERVPLARQDFPPRLCEFELKPGEKARVGEHELPERPAEPTSILVLGDTGCRMTFYQWQPCGDLDEWAFPDLAIVAAEVAKDKNVNLVIHVGDYHYREHSCPDRKAGCRASPSGDNWPVWKAEFFDPAAELLRAAPWVMVRGNHENCGRAGTGWHHFLGPRMQGLTGPKNCEDDTEPYLLKLSKMHYLAVLDTAAATETYQIEERGVNYYNEITGMLRAIKKAHENRDGSNGGPTVWVLVHQPLWAEFAKESDEAAKGKNGNDSKKVDQLRKMAQELFAAPIKGVREAVRDATNSGPEVSLVLSGDTHMFQYFMPENTDLPIQIVAGMGGTALEKAKGFTHITEEYNKALTLFGDPGQITGFVQFGFLLLTREGEAWEATLYNREGEAVLACPLPGSSDGVARKDAPCEKPSNT